MNVGKEYSHHLPVETLAEALSTQTWSQAQSAKFHQNGIISIRGTALKDKLRFYKWFIKDDQDYIVISNAYVQTKWHEIKLEISNIASYFSNIFIYNSNLPQLSFINCKLVSPEENNNSSISLSIIDSIVKGLHIEKCIIGNIDIWNGSEIKDIIITNTTIGYISIQERCKTESINLNKSVQKFLNVYKSNIGHIDLKDVTAEYFHIDQSTTGHFNFENSNFGNITLDNTTTGYFRLLNAKFGDVKVWDNSVTGEFRIHNSTLGYLSIHNSETDSFKITNSKSRYFKIQQSKIKNLSVEDQSGIGPLSITQESSTGIILIKDSTSNDINITFSIFECLKVENSKASFCNIADSITYSISLMLSQLKAIKIQNTSLEDTKILNVTSGSFEMHNVLTSLGIEKGNINQCKINSCDIVKFRVENECISEIYLSECNINVLDFRQLTLSKNSVISLVNCNIYACIVDEFVSLGNLFFRGLHNNNKANITKIPLPKIFSEKNSLFYKIKGNFFATLKIRHNGHLEELFNNVPFSTYRISHSSLGKTEFTECDLGAFNFEYNNSKITEIFISGGTMPKDINVYNETNPIKILEQKKSFFDQLKKVFEGQGDIVRGTHYHAKTSEIQMQIIEAGKRKWWFKYFDLEWLVYKLNEASNRHGESWGRAVIFTLGISIVGFIFYNHALEVEKYEFVHQWNTDWLGDWAQFILPTHKMDFIETQTEKYLSSDALFVDVLFRILIGYGIYQLISAFRKHGKKV